VKKCKNSKRKKPSPIKCTYKDIIKSVIIIGDLMILEVLVLTKEHSKDSIQVDYSGEKKDVVSHKF